MPNPVRTAIADARSVMRRLARQYQLEGDELPRRVRELLYEAARRKHDVPGALDLVRKAIERYLFHCIAAWARRSPTGERDQRRASSVARILRGTP